MFSTPLDIVQILQCDPLTCVINALDKIVVGEDSAKATLFLSKLSYMSKKPTHEIIRGESGAGKSHLANGVLQAFPPEDIIKVSRVTPTWTDYSGDDLRHKIVLIQQLGGAETAYISFQILMSERGLRLGTVRRTSKGWVPDQKETTGPISLLSTTTQLRLDPQMETRTFYISPDESPEQTLAIQEHQARYDASPWKLEEVNKEVYNIQKVVRFLNNEGIKDVVIPFSPLITFSSDKIRIRRDRPKLMTLVRSLAMLRQYKRRILENGKTKYVVAEWDDLVDVVKFCESVISQTFTELTENEEYILKNVKEWYSSRPFQAAELAKKPGITLAASTIRGHLNKLETKGYVELEPGGGRSKRNIYRLIQDTSRLTLKGILQNIEKVKKNRTQDIIDDWSNTLNENVKWYRYNVEGRLVPS